MFKTRGRKIMRDVLSRKMRTLLVSMSIFVGVLGVVTIVGGGNIMLQAILDNMQEDEIAMQQLFVVNPTGQSIENPAGELDELFVTLQDKDIGIEKLEGRATHDLQWIQPGNEQLSVGNVRSFSQPYGEIEVAPMQLLEGNYPAANNHEIMIEVRLSEKYDVQVGDKVELGVASLPANDDGELMTETWTVTGIVMHPYDDYTSGGLTPQSEAFYANYEDAAYLANFTGYNTLLLRYTDYATAEAQADLFTTEVHANTAYVAVFSFMEDPAENLTLRVSREYIGVFNMLGVIAMLVSGFFVFNVISTILVEQKQQIGIMKSIGATTWEIFTIYAGTAFVYGLLGMIPGVLLGIPASYWLAEVTGPLANIYISGFTISPLALGMGISMGLAVPVLASIIPVLVGSRVSILKALTDVGISGRFGNSPMARAIASLPLPVSVRQALSNIWQKGLRLLLTGATLTMAVAAFMGVTAVFSSVDSVIGDAFNTFDYEVTIEPNGQYDVADIENALVELDTVENVYTIISPAAKVEGYVDPQLGGDQLGIVGIDPHNNVTSLNLLEGHAWDANSPDQAGVVLTYSVAQVLDVGLGDTVDIGFGGDIYNVEVIGIDKFPFDLAYMHWENLATKGGFVQDGEIKSSAFLVQLEDQDWTAAEVENAMTDIRLALQKSGITATLANQVQVEEENSQQLMMIGGLFNIAAAVMAIVGALGLAATLFMAVIERQKEIGVMRSIGAGSSSIAVQFLIEGLLISVLAWIGAVPLSYLLSLGLMAGLPFGDFIKFTYPLDILPVGLVGIIVIALVASLWPSIAASRRTVSDILRYQ